MEKYWVLGFLNYYIIKKYNIPSQSSILNHYYLIAIKGSIT